MDPGWETAGSKERRTYVRVVTPSQSSGKLPERKNEAAGNDLVLGSRASVTGRESETNRCFDAAVVHRETVGESEFDSRVSCSCPATVTTG